MLIIIIGVVGSFGFDDADTEIFDADGFCYGHMLLATEG